MAVIALLTGAGIRVLDKTGPQARRAATDTCIGLIDQARVTAITSRTIVVLAIAEPGDLPFDDERCRLGIFKINTWPAHPNTLDATLVRRWQCLPGGTVILPGSVNNVRNPRDEPEITLRYFTGRQPVQGRFHLIAFTPRGALLWPAGSDPLVLRIAEGGYRNGQPAPNTRGSNRCIAENPLQIGRITARAYRIDG